MHTVGILAYDGVVAFDITTAMEVFGGVRSNGGAPLYRVLVAGSKRSVTAGILELKVASRLSHLDEVDTVIVPGLGDVSATVATPVLDALRRAHDRGARLASICVGALILADAGLLDGRPATTHWQATDLLENRGHDVRVDPDVLFVDDGDILTSAGAAAGIDLCLHMVERDFGASVAAAAARRSVVPVRRAGGQSQFVRRRSAAMSSFTLLLSAISERAGEAWTLGRMAYEAKMTTRTLSRRFEEEVGSTPIQWLNRERVRQAGVLLETTRLPVELIASEVGFGSSVTFRQSFRKQLGTTPSRYRAGFAAIRQDHETSGTSAPR